MIQLICIIIDTCNLPHFYHDSKEGHNMKEFENTIQFVSKAVQFRLAKTVKGRKKGGRKLGFYFGTDPIPKELANSVTVSPDGKTITIEACVESGSLDLPLGAFVAYEKYDKDDDRCPHGYNCWQKTNAPQTLVKGPDGNYYEHDQDVEVCVVSNGGLPWFLTDDKSPEIRIIGNEIEIMGSNGVWQRGTIGNAFFVYYNRETENGLHDVALVDADVESAKPYQVMVEATVDNIQTIIYVPLFQFLGTKVA